MKRDEAQAHCNALWYAVVHMTDLANENNGAYTPEWQLAAEEALRQHCVIVDLLTTEVGVKK